MPGWLKGNTKRQKSYHFAVKQNLTDGKSIAVYKTHLYSNFVGCIQAPGNGHASWCPCLQTYLWFEKWDAYCAKSSQSIASGKAKTAKVRDGLRLSYWLGEYI